MQKQLKSLFAICLAAVLLLSTFSGCTPSDTTSSVSGGSSSADETIGTDESGNTVSNSVSGENESAMNASTNNMIQNNSQSGNQGNNSQSNGSATATNSSKPTYVWSGEDDDGVMISDGFTYASVKPNSKNTSLTKSAEQYTGEIILYTLAPEISSGREDWDFGFMMLALQGLVNRDKPQLYYRTTSTALTPVKSEDYNKYITNLDHDLYWLTYLTSKGQYLEKAKITTYNGAGKDVAKKLLDKFKGYYNGLVVWDPDVASTQMVAATIAGADNLIPVRYDTSKDSIYTWLTKTVGLQVKIDLNNKFTGKSGSTIYGTGLKSTGSAKNDAYLYAKVNYLDKNKTSAEWIGHFMDAYPESKVTSGVESYTGTTRKMMDFLISEKAFMFDLCQFPDLIPLDDPTQKKGTDYSTMNEILKSQYKRAKGDFFRMAGWTTWKNGNYDKYDSTLQEFHFFQLLSSYNGVGEADANAANTSIFQHVPELSSYKQTGSTTPNMKKYSENTKYFMFYLGDFDSTTWLHEYLPRLWEQSARGKLPIAWNINGAQSDTCTAYWNYMYDTATNNDYFVAGNNGAGYLNMEYLEANKKKGGAVGLVPDGIDAWKAYNKKIFAKYDLSITPRLIFTGSDWNDRVIKSIADVSVNGLSYWNHAIGTSPKLITNNSGAKVPYVRQEYSMTNLQTEQEIYDYFMDHLTNAKYKNAKGMFSFNLTLVSPTTLVSVIERMKKEHPEQKFEVVDPYTFYAYAAKRAQ